MKKIFSLIFFAVALQAMVFSQTTTQDIIFNAHLLQTFNLNLLNGGTQEITFQNAADYNNGVVAGTGILPGTSDITIEATEDWILNIECPDFVGYAGPNGAGSGTIPSEDLGVTITATGAHTIATGEVTYTCTPGNPQQMLNATTLLIGQGANANAGDATDNAFTLTWEMGTAAVGYGTSMFDQMANGDFSTGDFTTTATLTLVPN
jgi:hypothetical protein